MAFDISGKIINASSCEDNCAKWMVEIGMSQRGQVP
ncbi:MAG: hypothetical protein IKE03_05175 [Blautia sp.]|nr:hypothetical protein [Blautia sp.]